MNDFGQKLFTGWHVNNWSQYLAAVFFAGIGIRIVLTGLVAWTSYCKSNEWPVPESYWTKYKRRFLGVRASTSENAPDYWIAFVLGFFELLMFPVLMVAGAWVAVGAWFTLKTVAQWDVWKANRNTFNLFLVGNAMMLLVAYLLAQHFVTAIKT